MFRYPVRIDPDGNGFVVSFPDIPEALTGGATLEEAREMAVDALLTAFEFYLEDGRPVPEPSPLKHGDEFVELSASQAAKILLLNELLSQKVRPVDLAKRLNDSPQSVNRLLNVRHVSKIDSVEKALTSLGRHLKLQLV
jgi:Uncharacterized conserved protein